MRYTFSPAHVPVSQDKWPDCQQYRALSSSIEEPHEGCVSLRIWAAQVLTAGQGASLKRLVVPPMAGPCPNGFEQSWALTWRAHNMMASILY